MSGKVGKVVELFRKLGENEFKEIANIDLDNGFTAEVGYAYKNGRGSYQIRLRYGITTLLKVRNSEEFEQIKKVIEFISKKKEILEALDQLNERPSRRVISSDAIEL